jgi:hypothetical protein
MSAAAKSKANGYTACRIKRRRPTQEEMLRRRQDIARIVEEIQPCSVRQTYYQAEVAKIIEKTENDYEKVQRAIVWLRQHACIPFDWIADATRWMRKPRSHNSIVEALEQTITTYRRAVWRDIPAYVEIWCEKDALAGTIYEMTEQYDVPLMVARGYSSLTFLHESAKHIEEVGKPAFIGQLGDWDPSGQNAADHIERKLREYAPGAEIHFTKLAVTEARIAEWKLPARPTKTTDSRAKRWKGDSVELDAIRPDLLRGLVRTAHLGAPAAGDRDRRGIRARTRRSLPRELAGKRLWTVISRPARC